MSKFIPFLIPGMFSVYNTQNKGLIKRLHERKKKITKTKLQLYKNDRLNFFHKIKIRKPLVQIFSRN